MIYVIKVVGLVVVIFLLDFMKSLVLMVELRFIIIR